MIPTDVVIVSGFDGMSCGRLATDLLPHLNVLRYYSSEIKSEAIKLADLHYPQDTQYRLGDITKIDGVALRQEIEKDFGPVKILYFGGSPCQDFSGANKERLGDKGTKSGLFYEYVRILNELNPDFFLLENVRMTKDHQEIVSNEMGCDPMVIKSDLVVPHLRHRLYWTNIPNITQPKDQKKLLNDHLNNGYSDRDKARTLLESDGRPLSTPIKMAHRYFNTGFTTLIFKDKTHYTNLKAHFDTHFKGHSALEINQIIVGMDLSIYDGVRYMTNNEREQCQSVPIGYTDSLSQNEAASLLGDGWTVSVIAHILWHIAR